MNWLYVVILGIIEGITEFLPISSTGHLNTVEKLLGYEINSKGMMAFTAVIQVGTILAAIIYSWKDIVRIVVVWFKGPANKAARQDPDYTLGWGVILGPIPVAVVGLLLENLIKSLVCSMWVVAGALIVWSVAMWLADRQQNLTKSMKDVSIENVPVISCFQAPSPAFPSISRSGATIPVGLFLRFNRVTATHLSPLLGIPALVVTGSLEAVTAGKHIVDVSIGWRSTIVVTVVSGVAVYVTIVWLLKFAPSNRFTSFLIYRVILGVVIIALILVGLVAA